MVLTEDFVWVTFDFGSARGFLIFGLVDVFSPVSQTFGLTLFLPSAILHYAKVSVTLRCHQGHR